MGDYVYVVLVKNQIVAVSFTRQAAIEVLEQREQEYQLENSFYLAHSSDNTATGGFYARYFDKSGKLLHWLTINRVRKEFVA